MKEMWITLGKTFLERGTYKGAILLTCLFIFLFFTKNQSTKSLQTCNNLMLSGTTVVVDAGHGGYDGGAVSKYSNTKEKEVTLSICLKIEALLKAHGAHVVMTRRTDKSLKNTKRADLLARLQMAVDNEADYLLSIHVNEYRESYVSGPQVFYRKDSAKSADFAHVMQQALIEHLAPQKERVAMAGDYLMLSLPLPSLLVECGFFSNQREEKLLLQGEYQEKIAQAIVQGVCEYVEENL